ncbi:Uu.00g016550.m01.CDS01 [Anthostomella pinea]|uniref:Uu.00g016550.m01.CDS01 n=1 Tax=Anthostomella pinea TaxID=933095 RepID=A0AAI8YQK9_9PEZI|nr:Uu.00g016550.m01.CDS01 [Anthostomella pinea]
MFSRIWSRTSRSSTRLPAAWRTPATRSPHAFFTPRLAPSAAANGGGRSGWRDGRTKTLRASAVYPAIVVSLGAIFFTDYAWPIYAETKDETGKRRIERVLWALQSSKTGSRYREMLWGTAQELLSEYFGGLETSTSPARMWTSPVCRTALESAMRKSMERVPTHRAVGCILYETGSLVLYYDGTRFMVIKLMEHFLIETLTGMKTMADAKRQQQNPQGRKLFRLFQ